MNGPVNKTGAIAVLRGNLAPEEAITKPAVIAKTILKFRDSAIVFESEQEDLKRIIKVKNRGV